MDSRELRTGNWLIDPVGREFQMNWVDFMSSKDKNDFKPIPLTEEWLIKFGFSRDGSYWSHRHLNILTVEKIGGGEMLMTPNRKYALELKHVHQLQNLYFALTGEELTTKK